MDEQNYFEGRKIVIATKHEKEAVIGPVLKKEFGISYVIPHQLDTDLLGTFSGEIERVLTPIEAARKKCELAFEMSDADLAIGSEGSFGPYPTLYFMPSDEEYLVLVDRKNKLEIVVKFCSLQTNYGSYDAGSEEKLANFLQRVKFPSHALIVKDSPSNAQYIDKGIRTKSHLNRAIKYCNSHFSTYHILTDMRAMYNPTRMSIIQGLTGKLVEKMRSCCPSCSRPGFSVTDVIRGLECSCCSLPTKSVKSLIYTCEGCHYTKFQEYPEAKQSEDPMFCDYCNP
jgi:hypothetical protein